MFRLLDRSRCLTLTGAGGCGKTRLALQAATIRSATYPGGVCWADLARLEDGGLLASAVIEAAGLEEVPGVAPQETLTGHFRDRQALLVLDNCEHLLTACAGLVDGLLTNCPRLTVLATSRAPLGLPAETIWRVPSLSLPVTTEEGNIGSAEGSDALNLFLERAAQVEPAFQATDENIDVLARICCDLDGMPLAIELAAARVRMMTPEQIASGLADRFHLLTGAGSAVLSRHQTLEESIRWSYALLSDYERIVVRRLSVFSGGWTLDAAEAVCSGGSIERQLLLDLLGSLVDQSLVTTADHGSQMRYGTLETVRQFLLARLTESGEEPEVRDAHLAHYLTLAEELEPELLGAGRGGPVMRRISEELPNFRAAQEWAVGREPESGQRIAVALSLFWLFTGRFREGEAAYDRALSSEGEAPAVFRGRCLAARAHLAQHAGYHKEALTWGEEALAVGRACGDPWTQGRALNTLGRAVSFRDPAAGRALLQRSLDSAVAAGDHWCEVSSTQAMAISWNFQDEFEKAAPLLQAGYEKAVRFGYRRGVALHWWCLGWQAIFRGRLSDALELLDRAVAASDEVGDPFPNGLARSFRALVLVAKGEWEPARRYADEALEHIRRSGAGLVAGIAARMLATAEIALGDKAAARSHLEAAVDWDVGFPWARSAHLTTLATLHRLHRDTGEAFDRAQEALVAAEDLGSPAMRAGARLVLGRLALDSGRVREAEGHAQGSLIDVSEKALFLLVPDCLDLLAQVALVRQSPVEAARLLGAAAGTRGRIGSVRFPPEWEHWAGIATALEQELGDAFQGQINASADVSTGEAVAYARRGRGRRKRPAAGWDSLTPTEEAVVALAATGLTNAQIAERMFVAPGTVKVHLSHIFFKLGVSSRAELAGEAAKRRPGGQPL